MGKRLGYSFRVLHILVAGLFWFTLLRSFFFFFFFLFVFLFFCPFFWVGRDHGCALL